MYGMQACYPDSMSGPGHCNMTQDWGADVRLQHCPWLCVMWATLQYRMKN